MITDTIPLRFAGERSVARLRELTGRDEFAVLGASTANAIQLLSALLAEAQGGADGAIRALDLVAADRDLLLAAIYERAFGDKIESTLTCARCGQPFDLHFSLRKLIETAHSETTEPRLTPLGGGNFETLDGFRFRLPTGNDELELAGLSAAEIETRLFERCALDGKWQGAAAGFEDLLEHVAPLLHLELVARCAECHHSHQVQFDIQSYVLGAIAAERRRLLLEIHRIARAYSWPLDDILSLSRSDRRQIVELIENENVT
jgi:hypothetical protein